jgi:NitT/TauT family transport system substrate-binding protein
MTQLEQRGDIRIIADTRTLKGSREVFGGTLPGACIFASSEFVQKNPHTVQALTDAVVHSLKWLLTAGPSDIIKTVPETYLLGDRAVYLAAFNKLREVISPDGVMPDDGPRTALRVLAAFDASIKTATIDLGRTYSNLFAKQVPELFKARRPNA